jgi:hypothetical protein
MKTTRSGLLSVLFLVFGSSVFGQVPQLINYQGRVAVGGTNFDGNGQFKFALVNGAGGVTFWSNDGTSVAGSQPTAQITLTVTRGLYAVLLGDVTIAGMTQIIPSSVFANPDVRLRVWFNDGVTGFQLLSPDQRIAAVGYALMSATVPDGAITAAKLADGAVTAAKLAPGAVTSATLGDSLALGNPSNAVGRLDVYRTSAGTAAISLIGSSSQISTFGSDGQEQARIYGTSWGELLLFNSLSNNATAVRLTAQGSTGGQLELRNTNGANRAVLEGENVGGTLTLYTSDGNVGSVLYGNEGQGSGALSLRNTNGSPRLRGFGGPVSGSLQLLDAAGTTTFIADGAEGAQGSQINMYQANGIRTLQFDAENGTAGGGYAAVYAGDGGAATISYADSQGGAFAVYEEDGTLTTLLHNVSDAGVVSVRNSAGVETAYLWGRNSAGQTGGQIGLKNSSGVQTITLDADNVGDGKVTTQVLQITGGSDLSEQFDVKPLNDDLQPGMIVCIDPAQPGQLVTSTKEYDKTVAGVLSGAGGVKTGMMMGQVGTAADGKHAVALTGRVYCLVDATKGAIMPGDLITTSSTPGYGMKVKSHKKAQGAIIGKAMSPLANGKGLVLVLVSLQ